MVYRKLKELVMEIVRDYHSLKIAQQMRYITRTIQMFMRMLVVNSR